MNKQQRESSRKTEPQTRDSASSQDKINSELKLTLEASEYKKEITPLIDETELEFAVKLSAIRAMERDVLSTKLGRPMYSIASYENVKRATISLDRGMFLLVSFERNADDALIINKVMNELNISYTLSLCELGSR